MSNTRIYTQMFKSYPDALSVKDLQSMLGISKNSAYKLLNDKKIGHTKIGRRFIVPKKNVIVYLVENHN